MAGIAGNHAVRGKEKQPLMAIDRVYQSNLLNGPLIQQSYAWRISPIFFCDITPPRLPVRQTPGTIVPELGFTCMPRLVTKRSQITDRLTQLRVTNPSKQTLHNVTFVTTI